MLTHSTRSLTVVLLTVVLSLSILSNIIGCDDESSTTMINVETQDQGSSSVDEEEPPLRLPDDNGRVLMCTEEVCDGLNNDCDDSIDEGLFCPCDANTACYGGPPQTQGVGQCVEGQRACDGFGETWLECMDWVGPADEVCDQIDNDCDGQVDEGLSEMCAQCGPISEEVCDLTDNDCDGQVDEDGCVISEININGDCVVAECPPEAPYPIACQISFQGEDLRGCVAYTVGESVIFLKEGNDCGVGSVMGTLTCSTLSGGGLNAQNCPINKETPYYPMTRDECPN